MVGVTPSDRKRIFLMREAKSKVVYYYEAQGYSDISHSIQTDPFLFHSYINLMDNQGSHKSDSTITYRGQKAEALPPNQLDHFWEKFRIETPTGAVTAEAFYEQSTATTESAITDSSQQLFNVIGGGEGDLQGAISVLVEYDNDLTQDWSDAVRNLKNSNGEPLKFRRVTVNKRAY
jgi:hypothetical protein